MRHAVDIGSALRLARDMAKAMQRVLGGRVPFDDLLSAAHERLVMLLRDYDSAVGTTFEQYAKPRLKWAMLDALRKEDGLPRSVARLLREADSRDLFRDESGREEGRLRAHVAGIRCVEGREAEPVQDEAYARAELRRLLEEAILDLPLSERTIILLHYFADDDQDEASAAVGLSKSWGCRLHARGISRLAERLRPLASALRDEWNIPEEVA